MPYDIVDAYAEIKEIQATLKIIIEELQDKNIISKPTETK